MSQTPPGSKEAQELLRALDEALGRGGGDPLEALAAVLRRDQGRPDPSILAGLQGEEVGGYRIERLIGIGGMGATYLGRSPDGEEVAVKVVGILSPERRERFEVECRILRKLDHPAIVRYRDHGVLEDGSGFLVMDYVPGVTLQQVLDLLSGEIPGRGGIPLLESVPLDRPFSSPKFRRRMVRLIASCAEALAFAHELGVVHRDIKPANVILRDGREPVLIDFGLGRDLFRCVSLTRSSAILGTLSYMSPEQLEGNGNQADPRSDVFALGLVLFRCLTGRELRRDFNEVLAYGRRPFLFARDDAGRIDPPLRAVLYKCLDPKPERRYGTMRELATDLHAYLESGRVSARNPGLLARFWRGRAGRPSLAVASLVLVAGGAYLFGLPPAPHYLWVDLLWDGIDLRIDGGPKLQTPLVRNPIAPGPHSLVFSPPWGAKIRRDFVVDRRFTRITILNRHSNKGKPAMTFYGGDDGAYLKVLPGPKAQALRVDGREAPLKAWVRLAPGQHELLASGEGGVLERKMLEFRPGELHYISMLPEITEKLEGSYRLTLYSVLSPLPPGINLSLSDGAVRFLNDFGEDNAQPGEAGSQAGITSTAPGKEVTAELRVRFPEAMRSLAFYSLSDNRKNPDSEAPPASELEVEYRVEGRPWVAMPGDGNLYGGLIEIVVPAQGTRWFELRARILVRQEPLTWTPVHFLTTYVDHSAMGNAPSFALVADPRPGVVRLPRPLGLREYVEAEGFGKTEGRGEGEPEAGPEEDSDR